MAITQFTKSSFTGLRADIEAALEPVRAKYGLKELRIGNIGFSPVEFKTQLIGKVDETASPEAKKVVDDKHESYSKMLGFDRNVVGERIRNGIKTFTVTEIHPDRPKWPITAKSDLDGKLYKFQRTVRFENPDIKNNYSF